MLPFEATAVYTHVATWWMVCFLTWLQTPTHTWLPSRSNMTSSRPVQRDVIRYDATTPEDAVWQTYPPFVLAYRSLVFMLITIALAEMCGRWNNLLQPRDVPTVITSAVVLSGQCETNKPP